MVNRPRVNSSDHIAVYLIAHTTRTFSPSLVTDIWRRPGTSCHRPGPTESGSWLRDEVTCPPGIITAVRCRRSSPWLTRAEPFNRQLTPYSTSRRGLSGSSSHGMRTFSTRPSSLVHVLNCGPTKKLPRLRVQHTPSWFSDIDVGMFATNNTLSVGSLVFKATFKPRTGIKPSESKLSKAAWCATSVGERDSLWATMKSLRAGFRW
mmetsp:Transcript_58893/g.179629  ORF Transcript_58893/g.179629 Transcript_58893/m.179629 type:complete len:206 (+) Transcript_58893:872-1489(+)